MIVVSGGTSATFGATGIATGATTVTNDSCLAPGAITTIGETDGTRVWDTNTQTDVTHQ